MGLLRIMDYFAGDKQTVFDPSDPVSVEAAMKVFNDAIAEGGGPNVVPVFTKGENGQHNKVPPGASFDPTAEEILITRQLAGG